MDQLDINTDVSIQQAIFEGYALDEGNQIENTHNHMIKWFDNKDYLDVLKLINDQVDIDNFAKFMKIMINNGLLAYKLMISIADNEKTFKKQYGVNNVQ